MLFLTDETGLSPLPPGILVTIATASGVIVGSGYTQIGGTVDVELGGAIEYVATFAGNGAPTQAQAFVGNAQPNVTTSVAVVGYISPFMSSAGQANALSRNYVRKWLGDAAKQRGGLAQALFAALGWALGQLDSQEMQIIAAQRPQTAKGIALDSWVYDFLGNYLLRYLDESDAIYYTRALAVLKPGRTTLAAISQIVTSFYVATAQQRLQQTIDANLGFDTDFGAFDSNLGAYDQLVAAGGLLIPVISVWDTQSNLALAQQYGVYPGQFVVQIGFSGAAAGWFLDYSGLDINAVLIDGAFVSTSTTPPDPRLGALVNFIKGAGYLPLYQTYIA